MSQLKTRLEHLGPALSAKQRFLLVVRATRAGTPVGPDPRHTMPPEQVTEFNRYCHLLWVADAFLGWLVRVNDGDLDVLEGELDLVTWLLGADGEQAKTGSAGAFRPRQGDAKPRWRTVRDFALERRSSLVDKVVQRWQELRAIEMVWDEIARTFDGEDAVSPDRRQSMTSLQARLQRLAAALPKGKRLLTGPDEAQVEQIRAEVRAVYDQLGWAHPEAAPR